MVSTPLITANLVAQEVFLMDGQARNFSPRSIRSYRQQRQMFNKYLALQNRHNLNEITPSHIRAYLFYLQDERNRRPASVHAAARSLRAYLNFCYAEEMMPSNPVTRVKMPKVKDEPLPAFTHEDIHKLAAAARTQRDRALILCLLDTGCRASEFLAWNVVDANLPAGTVRVRQTKNGKERILYLGIRARRELMKMVGGQSLAPDDRVWRTLHAGKRLRYDGLKTLLRDLGHATGVKPRRAQRRATPRPCQTVRRRIGYTPPGRQAGASVPDARGRLPKARRARRPSSGQRCRRGR